ncbi:hypothetical protein J2W89_003799 [Pseudarthrobacter oxydans]|uniref:hypothetical protein n=1 Tax=Pseudarthrobacter oxydans TaxID=1671 RepID=UPI0028626D39|nr:hypothetical protein [Pseudarthrobacter oxydans]MDR6794617.1 hypothetical protein [Pseudarthrobacter oxydans]
MKLTTRIKSATDGKLSLDIEELPALEVDAKNVGEIPEAVQAAAARLTGRDKSEFIIEVRY